MTGLAYSPADPGRCSPHRPRFRQGRQELQDQGRHRRGHLLDAAGVHRLADMPGPRELKAQFLALLNTPATSFVRVLNAAPQSLLYLLNARKDQLAA
jgi:large subunit ribosomal protein L10